MKRFACLVLSVLLLFGAGCAASPTDSIIAQAPTPSKSEVQEMPHTDAVLTPDVLMDAFLAGQTPVSATAYDVSITSITNALIAFGETNYAQLLL